MKLEIQLFNILFVNIFNYLRIFFLWVQVSNMTPPKAFIVVIFNVNQYLGGFFFSSVGNSICDDPFNGLYITML